MKIISNSKLLSVASIASGALLGLTACQDREVSEAPNTQSENVEQVSGDEAPSLSDADVAETIQRELFYDPSISTHAMDVKVSDGVVELTGTVKNLLAKDRAAYIASQVKGVRAISNRLNLDVVEVSDALLKNAVEGALILDPTTERFGIEVDVEDQVVTLTGKVQSYAEKSWAERAAKYVAGVREVKNQVEVDYRVNRTDQEIAEDVRGNLRWDSVVNDGLVKVDVDNGYVSLSGVVGSLAEIERARTNAWVAGVKGVETRQMKVEWWAENDKLRQGKFVAKSDTEVSKALDDALLFDPRVNPYGIASRVTGGVATLDGEAPSLAAKQAAEEVASNVVGVVRVVNNIEVDPGSELDPALRIRLDEGLKNNVMTSTADIGVEVESGVAILTGQVNNYAQKAHAEMLAQTLQGIREVDNRLTVTSPAAFALSLEGTLDTPYQYPAVTAWASRVSSVPLKTDLEMKADIERELSWSPYVDPDDISVRVDNGVATLTGVVDSLRERRAAVANAYQGGAVSVQDRMTY